MDSPTIPNTIFNQIPSDGLPSGFMAEVDATLAGTYTGDQPALLIGQMLATGTATAGERIIVPGNGTNAAALFGAGSQLALMVERFRARNQTTTLYAVPMADPAGVAATLDVTVTGTATASGYINLHVGATRVRARVLTGATAATVATAIAAAITAESALPVTATADAGVVTITARGTGSYGNAIRVQLNRLGLLGNESTPAGLSVAIPDDGYLADGAGEPDQTLAVIALGDEDIPHVGMPWTDTTSLDAWADETLSRWHPLRMLYGRVYSARRGSLSEVLAFGAARNDPHISVMWAPGVDPDWLDTAGYCAIAARSLANHPARPLQTLDWGAADPGEKLVWSDRHAALAAGVATWNRSTSGAVTIDRAVSTYTQSAGGLTDNAWRDITTSATVERILRELRFAMERQWIDTRCVLVDDGTPIHPLVPHATPRRVKASLIAHYRNLEFKGFTEREREFVDRLQVGRDPDYPTRLIVYYPPDLANPLIQLDIQVGFSLQFASAA